VLIKYNQIQAFTYKKLFYLGNLGFINFKFTINRLFKHINGQLLEHIKVYFAPYIAIFVHLLHINTMHLGIFRFYLFHLSIFGAIVHKRGTHRYRRVIFLPSAIFFAFDYPTAFLEETSFVFP